MQKFLKEGLLIGTMACMCVSAKADPLNTFGIPSGKVKDMKGQLAGKTGSPLPQAQKALSSPPPSYPPPASPPAHEETKIPQYESTLSQRQHLSDMKTKEKGINPDFEKRQETREEGKKLQKLSKKMSENVDDAMDKLSVLPKMTTIVGGLSGDPHTKLVRIGTQLLLAALEGLAKIPSGIMMAVGRYKERSQEFLTVNEILIVETMKSLEDYDKLEKKEKELLEPLSQSKNKQSIFSTLSQKINNATDSLYLTDNKGERAEELEDLHKKLKKAREKAENNIRTLQIKLLQDGIKQIDRIINKNQVINGYKDNPTGNKTIRAGLKEVIQNLTEQKAALSKGLFTKSKSKMTKKVDEINEQIAKTEAEISFLEKESKLQTPKELQSKKAVLIAEIKHIEPQTLLGKAQYVENKGLDYDNLLSKEGMIAIHRELDTLKDALCSLGMKTEPVKKLCPEARK